MNGIKTWRLNMNPGNWFHLKRSAALLLALVMAAVFLSPVCACAENSRKIVRVV